MFSSRVLLLLFWFFMFYTPSSHRKTRRDKTVVSHRVGSDSVNWPVDLNVFRLQRQSRVVGVQFTLPTAFYSKADCLINDPGEGKSLPETTTLEDTSKFCMKLDHLILRKIIKSVAARCQILRLKCTNFDFGWGSIPGPAGGAYSAPLDPVANGSYF